MKYFPLTFMQQIEEISELQLTGSRFFKTNHENSDYDFIVVTNQEVLKDFLRSTASSEEVTVKDISNVYVKSKSTFKEVWRLCFKTGPDVDLQFCENAAHKLRAQNWIDAHLKMGFQYPEQPPKRVQLWEEAFKATEMD